MDIGVWAVPTGLFIGLSVSALVRANVATRAVIAIFAAALFGACQGALVGSLWSVKFPNAAMVYVLWGFFWGTVGSILGVAAKYIAAPEI